MPFCRALPAALALLACLAAPCAAEKTAEEAGEGAMLRAELDPRRAPHAAGPTPSPSGVAEKERPPADAPAEPLPLDSQMGDDANRLLSAPPPTLSAAQKPNRPDFLDLSWGRLSMNSVGAAAAALTIVVGLFLLLVTFLKKAAPRSHRSLPPDVVTVLGRMPLSGKQAVHLLKVGGKLVLVCVTPEGVAPISEVTDPEEVVRLLGLCEQQNDHSASAAFRDVFDRLTREHSAPSYLDEDAGLVDRQQLAAAYANTPGGRA